MVPPPPASGPSRPAKRAAAPAAGPSSRPAAKATRPGHAPAKPQPQRPASAAAARKGKAPLRGPAAAAALAASNLQEGEEEWAKLMKKTHNDAKGADWYARGVKTVEVRVAAAEHT